MPTGKQQPTPRRTNVYIDSWNLYYGCLKKTPFRWINVEELARRSMPDHYHISRIRFFTAASKAWPDDLQAPIRQETLFRALQTLPSLTMHYGNFMESERPMRLVTPLPDGTKTVQAVRSEEKGSDVNLATYLLVDAYEKDFDAAVVVSGDSDLVEPIRIVRNRLKLHVTVLCPRDKSWELSQAATRFRAIDRSILGDCQFPDTLTDANGTFTKPAAWR